MDGGGFGNSYSGGRGGLHGGAYFGSGSGRFLTAAVLLLQDSYIFIADIIILYREWAKAQGSVIMAWIWFLSKTLEFAFGRKVLRLGGASYVWVNGFIWQAEVFCFWLGGMWRSGKEWSEAGRRERNGLWELGLWKWQVERGQRGRGLAGVR